MRSWTAAAIEFTIGTDGHVSEVHGLDNVFENDQVRQAAEQWMLQVSSPAMAPGGVRHRAKLELGSARGFHASRGNGLAK